MGVLAKAPPELPHPKSFEAGLLGSGLFWGAKAAGAAGTAGAAGVDQSLEPQISAPEELPNALVVVFWGAGATAAAGGGDERLKTLLDADGLAMLVGGGGV